LTSLSRQAATLALTTINTTTKIIIHAQPKTI